MKKLLFVLVVLVLGLNSLFASVEMTSFTLYNDGVNINLTWTTASEHQNSCFVVVRLMFSNARDPWVYDTMWTNTPPLVIGQNDCSTPHTYTWSAPVATPGDPKSSNVFRMFTVENGTGNQTMYYPEDSTSTGVDDPVVINNVPTQLQLSQNYPNPFNPVTTIQFSIPKAGNVTLKVYNITGQEVAILFSKYVNAGTIRSTFNGSNLSSGVYFARLEYNGKSLVQRMIMTK
jgi:hypothetical protein